MPVSQEAQSLINTALQAMADEGGIGKAIVEQAMTNPIAAISQYVSKIAIDVLSESPGDFNVVMEAVAGITIEIAEKFINAGIDVKPEDTMTIIGSVMMSIAEGIPELGQAMLQDPQLQQALQADPRVQEEMAQRQQQPQAPQSQMAPQQPQGLLTGAQ